MIVKLIFQTLCLFLLVIPCNLFTMPTKEFIVENAVKIDHLEQLPSKLSTLLASFYVFLIGETHGTKESPTFCFGLVKLLAEGKKSPLLLALEISEAEQPIIDEFMRTGNTSVFKQSALFAEKQPYGISSEAMVQLLSSLRSINNVKVICSLSKDPPSKAIFQENQEERDSKWASILLKQIYSRKYSCIVVLGGTFHMSLTPQLIMNIPLKTMGYYLTHSKDYPLSVDQILYIDIKSKEVNAWGCFLDISSNNDKDLPPSRCGEMNISNPEDNYSTAVNWSNYFLMESSLQNRHRATLFIRKLSASKPFIPNH